MPGTYNLTSGITIPASTAIRGINALSVIIQMLNVSQDTTLITMGIQTRLEDVTLNLTSSNPVNLTGIFFPSTTTTTSRIRSCVINVTSTSLSLSNVYGLYSNAITTNPLVLLPNSVMRAVSVNVNSTTTGIVRGIYLTNTCQFVIRECDIFASGTSNNIIGVESTTPGQAYILLKTSTISGTTNDIKQPSGLSGSSIILAGTDLVNSNPSVNGFSVNSQVNQLYYSVMGSIPTGTYYLTPGNLIGPQMLSSMILSMPFNQTSIIFSITANYTIALTGTQIITINLYNTTTPNIGGTGNKFATIVFNSSSSGPTTIQNFSSVFRPSVPNYLQVEIVTVGTTGTGFINAALFISISKY
jgi:hypothetical protein